MKKSIVYMLSAAGIAESSMIPDSWSPHRPINSEELSAWEHTHPKLVECIRNENVEFVRGLVLGYDEAVYLTPKKCEKDAGDYIDRYREHVQYLKQHIQLHTTEYVREIKGKANTLSHFTKSLALRRILGSDDIPEEYIDRVHLAERMKEALESPENREIWKDLWTRARAAYDRYLTELPVPGIPYSDVIKTTLTEEMEWYWKYWSDSNNLHFDYEPTVSASESESHM